MNDSVQLSGTIALLADVHGNLPALEAVLGDLTRFDVTDVVSLGDMANFGPAPRESLRRLRSLEPVTTILGNTDHYLLHPRALADVTAANDDTPRFLAVEAWCADRLLDEDREFIGSFQPTARLVVDEVEVLAYHGSPLSFDDQVRSATPNDTLDRWFDGHGAAVLAGAHTHEQFARRYHDAILLNPGSVGMPFRTPKGGTIESPSVAEYALLSVVNGQPNINLRRVRYDLADLEALGGSSGMPHWEWWFGPWRQA
ncbi:MAG TPA: metallophosphoesterase family protein [Trueperaceae bacterium]|nr:metallophosphoesterase family protein [Trueperaceae bacterium]